jgi:23S rRNA (cytidine1920-2'-O)/16S rRNA (cytidine1409-2'-O)-methyltransferase
LAASRAQAVTLIEAGRVLVGGAPAAKPSRLVAPSEPVVVLGDPPRYVGRGGNKLDAALNRFSLDPTGLRVLDVGSSTGGFTDCLLQHGAAHVTALDVGHGQLHERLRHDPRVEARERTDIRHAELPRVYDLIVGDVSFISLRLVAGSIVEALRPPGDIVVLVKPQFEVGKKEASRGKGVIQDPALWREALLGAINAFNRAGAAMMGVMVSPLRGGDGNTEFLVHFKLGPQALTGVDVEGAVDEVLAHLASGAQGS